MQICYEAGGVLNQVLLIDDGVMIYVSRRGGVLPKMINLTASHLARLKYSL